MKRVLHSHAYKIIGSATVTVAEAVNVLFSQSPKVKGKLNLIACAGNFDNSTQQYDKRVIISAELVST